MWIHNNKSDFEKATPISMMNAFVNFQMGVLWSMSKNISQIMTWGACMDATSSLDNITKSLKEYSQDENLLSNPNLFSSFMKQDSNWEWNFSLENSLLWRSKNATNPYHMFIETQKARKMYFEVALNQIKAMKAINPFLSPILQQAENFARTNLAFTFTFARPDWNLPFKHETVWDLDFCNVVRFEKPKNPNGKSILLVAPMSGHYATLLRKTVKWFWEQGYEVYITDWKSPFDVPKEKWNFDIDRQTKEIQNCFKVVRDNCGDTEFHTMAVCQPSPETATAITDAEQEGLPKPDSIALMAGPNNTTKNPTKINEAGDKLTPGILQWLQVEIPKWYKWAGRKTYPAALQIISFIMTKPEEHIKNYQKLAFKTTPFTPEEEKQLEFYTEYFAILDLYHEFYESTVTRVFQWKEWIKGKIRFWKKVVDLATMKTPLATIEAQDDDICWIGQTEAIHDVTPNTVVKKHILVKGKTVTKKVLERGKEIIQTIKKKVGHYGVFAGEALKEQVLPFLDIFHDEVRLAKIKK
jgi:poly(3-hydroxybutyrate) depolymerase